MELLRCDKPGLAQGDSWSCPRPAGQHEVLTEACLGLGQAQRAWDPWRGLTHTHSAWRPVRAPPWLHPEVLAREQGQQPGVRAGPAAHLLQTAWMARAGPGRTRSDRVT